MSLAKLAAKLLLVWCTAAKAVLEALNCFFFFFFFFFLGGKDIHYTSAMIATSRVCDVHHKPERPKLTTHLEFVQA